MPRSIFYKCLLVRIYCSLILFNFIALIPCLLFHELIQSGHSTSWEWFAPYRSFSVHQKPIFWFISFLESINFFFTCVLHRHRQRHGKRTMGRKGFPARWLQQGHTIQAVTPHHQCWWGAELLLGRPVDDCCYISPQQNVYQTGVSPYNSLLHSLCRSAALRWISLFSAQKFSCRRRVKSSVSCFRTYVILLLVSQMKQGKLWRPWN